MKFYGVKRGVTPGIYRTWDTTAEQVKGFSGAIYKSFPTFEQARDFVNGKDEVEHSSPIQDPAGRTMDAHLILSIYTDGSCKDSIGGFAAVFMFPDGQIQDLYGRVPTMTDGAQKDESVGQICTNNRAELYAILIALDHLKFLRDMIRETWVTKVNIYSDSKISIDSLTTWIKTWKRNGWTTAAGKPVENQLLIQTIDQHLTELSELNISFEHVYGHTGNVGNERANTLAEVGREGSDWLVLSEDAE